MSNKGTYGVLRIAAERVLLEFSISLENHGFVAALGREASTRRLEAKDVDVIGKAKNAAGLSLDGGNGSRIIIVRIHRAGDISK